MTRSQPPPGGHSSGSSRDSHDQDHAGYHPSEQYANRTPSYERTAPRPAQVSSQVPRSSKTEYSDLARVVNNPALDVAPILSRHQIRASCPSNTQRRGSTARSSIPSPSPHTRPPTNNPFGGSSSANQTTQLPLTMANFEEHKARQRPINSMQRLEDEEHRARPYDAIGYIRQDGQVYDENEVYEEYREFED
ncbi:hypothetical protein EJ02DRAFT_431068 [Clathrospora elynae]|uniref:Uncharacterized protein n=1 Tax=Clathrospora elynae TaxID=706981 RepID=A0A6A5T1X8_9PLEO|nr:hypothetical protein EJ02DRAFT_431068 [Clathrospora elynae]